MRKQIQTVAFFLIALSLTACTMGGKPAARVKCPACGYEFDVNSKG